MSTFDPRRSLRARLAWVFALLGLVLAAGIGIAVFTVTANQLTSAARTSAADAVTLAADAYNHTGVVLIGAVEDDRHAPPELRAAVSNGKLGTDVVGHSVWAGTPLSGGRGIYVRQPSDVPQTLSRLSTTLMIVGIVAVLLAAGLGLVVAGGLSRRLRIAAAVADEVAEGDLDARIGAAGDDEVARLGRAIDAMSVAVSERIERERRFSADVAHELRTPLTALVSAAALLDDGRPAQIVRERVAALRTLVEDLLEVLRLDQGHEQPQQEEVDLLALVRRVVDERGGAAAMAAPSAAGATVPGATGSPETEGAVRVDGTPVTVRTDPRRLERIVGNLLDNALRHGGGPVHITVSTGVTFAVGSPADVARADPQTEIAVIEVRDSGPGFPDELLSSGPAPFRTGASERGTGTGLGLVIASSQAALIGARLRLDNAPEGGAVATLWIPRYPVSPFV